jgi:cytochrome c5
MSIFKQSLSVTFILASMAGQVGYAADPTPVDLKVGEDLYGQLCFACHNEGVFNAPRLGVKEDWQTRLPMGIDTLYKAVIEGPNHMYSKGNSPLESEGQIKSMIAFMMNSVTDAETSKLIDTATPTEKERHLWLVRGYKLYDDICFKCHDTGDAGAPRLGVKDDWAGRKGKDIDALTKSIVEGKGHMYARAGTANYSEADFKSMIAYMLSTVEKPTEAAKPVVKP